MKTLTLLPTALAALALLAGCAAPPLNATAPPRLPGAWTTPQAGPQSGTQALPADWWTPLADPLLPALIERARAQSPSLAQARARLARATAGREAAQAALAPRVGLELAPQRGQMAPPLRASTSALWTVQAGWEIDLFGSTRASRDAAGQRAVAAQLNLDQAQVSLDVEVAQALLAWRHADAQTRLAAEDQALAERLATADAAQAQAGVLSSAGAALSQTIAAAARSRHRAWQEQRGIWLQTLAVLCADEANSLATELATRPAALPVPQALRVETVPAELLERRPDLRAALHQWQAAALDAHAARIDQTTPQLSLGALAGRGRWELSSGTLTGQVWNLAPTLSLPLFDFGGRAAATAAARATEAEARAGLEAQWRGAVSEVEQALLRWHAASAERVDATTTRQHWQRIAEATRAQARAGLASPQAQARDQRNLLTATSAELDAAREHVAAYLQLVRALGGGWQASAAATTAAVTP